MIAVKNADVDEKRRSLDTPATRMFWKAGEAPSAIDAAIESAKALRKQQQHLLADDTQVRIALIRWCDMR